MNWLARILQLIPFVVAGVETMHKDAKGATKKQMAMDALGIASAAAEAGLPSQTPAIQAATQLTSSVIDGVVSFNNAAGIFPPKTAVPAVPVKVSPKS